MDGIDPNEQIHSALIHGASRIRAARHRLLDLTESVADMEYRRDAHRATMLLALQAELAGQKTNAEQREAMLTERLNTDSSWTDTARNIQSLHRALKLSAIEVDYEQDIFRAALALARMRGTDD